MWIFNKKKSWPYSWKSDPYKSNLYRIFKHKNWFMLIQMNGEYPVSYQEEKMDFLVEKLNKGR